MDDVLIIGGGVIGLSLAFDLVQHGLRVRVVDRQAPGQESSWAGAGILSPAVLRAKDPSIKQLAGLSYELHVHWAAQLKSKTGINNGFRCCHALYLARDAATYEALVSLGTAWREQGIPWCHETFASLAKLEPGLATTGFQAAYRVPSEAQIRNPWHVRALLAACLHHGVQVDAGVAVDDWDVQDGRVRSVITSQGRLSAERYCICGGAWSAGLAARLGWRPAIKPVRGQIVLLNTLRPKLRHIINEGPRYLVPRGDGRILVGSTEEDVGFVKQNTAAAIEGLLAFAQSLYPELSDAPIERCWSGLRPATADGLPYLGRVPSLDNAFIAAGHFRQGLFLSPGTAVVMSQLIRGLPPEIDLSPFRMER